MENSDSNLGGGPPTPAEREAMDEHVSNVVAAAEAALAPEAPTSPSMPQQIERADLLEYKLFSERAARAELQITMYHRELQRSQAEANAVAHEAGQFMETLEKKYTFDRRISTITEDGYVVPRPIDQRAALMRK